MTKLTINTPDQREVYISACMSQSCTHAYKPKVVSSIHVPEKGQFLGTQSTTSGSTPVNLFPPILARVKRTIDRAGNIGLGNKLSPAKQGMLLTVIPLLLGVWLIIIIKAWYFDLAGSSLGLW